MSSNSTFPAPVGGVPFPHDFAPSVFFAVLYAVCVPIVFFRLIHKRSRMFVIIGTMIFTIERIVDFSLRAEEARSPSKRDSVFYVSYLQTAYAAGFIGIGQDLVVVVRTFLVNSTRGSAFPRTFPPANPDAAESQQPLTNDYGDATSTGASGYRPIQMSMSMEDADAVDEPRRRFWIRRVCGASSLIYWVAVILATVSGASYWAGITKPSQAQLTQQTRYAATALTLALLQITNFLALWAWWTRPLRVQRNPALLISVVSCLLSITALYRLGVMSNQTTSLLSMSSHSLNTPSEKALFYVFHIAPEWLAGAVLLGVNVKETFNTGLAGDWRSKDPKD